MGTAHVVIAVKDLVTAKTRLADSFTDVDRARLVVAMLQDTGAAALAVDAVAGITVVTPDPAVAEVAIAMGARVVADPSTPTSGANATRLNSAFAAAAAKIRDEGSHDIIALQADLPALRTEELAQAYALAEPDGRSIVSDHHGTGTAALILKGTSVQFASHFGPSSAQLHRRSGARSLDGQWPGLRLDVDTVEDVRLAFEVGVGVATAEVLSSLGW